MNYFDRLLARATATPAQGKHEGVDDPFEQVAPWELEAPNAPILQRKERLTDRAAPAMLAHAAQLQAASEMQNGEWRRVAQRQVGTTLQPEAIASSKMEQVREQPTGDKLSPPQVGHSPDLHGVTVLTQTAAPATYLNQNDLNRDDPLAGVDAFMQTLGVPMASPPAMAHVVPQIAASLPKEIAQDHPSIKPAQSPQMSAAPHARIQPPHPELVAANSAVHKPAPSEPETSAKMEAGRSPAEPKRVPEASPAPSIITVVHAHSVAEQYAQKLGAMACFGIGQL